MLSVWTRCVIIARTNRQFANMWFRKETVCKSSRSEWLQCDKCSRDSRTECLLKLIKMVFLGENRRFKDKENCEKLVNINRGLATVQIISY